MSAQVLALVVRTERSYPGGEFVDFDVCDSRTGEAIATRSCLPSANDVAAYLNSTYPVGVDLPGDDQVCVAPAHDTLVHEVIAWRIGGPQELLAVWWLENKPRCPWGVPTGPGWDHLIEEARREALN